MKKIYLFALPFFTQTFKKFFSSLYQDLFWYIVVIKNFKKKQQKSLLPLLWILFKMHCLLKHKIPLLFDFLVW